MNLSANRINILCRFLSEFITRAAAFIMFPLLARFIGAEGYGIQAQINAINGVLVPIATIGLGFSVVRLTSGKVDYKSVSARFNTSIIVVVCLSAALAAVLIGAAPYLNDLLVKVDWATAVMRWSAPLILTTAVNVTIGDYYRARLRIVSCSVFQVAGTMLAVIGSAVILLAGGGLLSVVKVTLVAQCLQSVAMVLYFSRVGEIHIREQVMSRDETVEMMRYGMPIVVMSVSTWVLSMGDRFVIGYYMDAGAVGIYNAAYVLATMVAALAGPFWFSLYPLMAKYMRSGEKHMVESTCRKYSNSYFIVAVPMIVGLTVMSSDILQLLGTRAYAINPIIFGLIVFGMFFDQFTANAHYLVYLNNEPKFMRNVTVAAGVLNIVMNVVLIPMIGLWGAAVSTFVSYAFMDIIVIRRMSRYGYSFFDLYDVVAIGKYAMSAVVMFLALYGMKVFLVSMPVSIVFLIAGGAVVYVAALWTMRGLSVRGVNA